MNDTTQHGEWTVWLKTTTPGSLGDLAVWHGDNERDARCHALEHATSECPSGGTATTSVCYRATGSTVLRRVTRFIVSDRIDDDAGPWEPSAGGGEE